MGQAKRLLAKRKKGRTEGSYTAWPHACARSENYKTLSAHAKALLLDFLGQFTGYNNGDLCCAFKLLKQHGWRSRTTVEKARMELEQKGWIVQTQQGGRNRPNLYALTIFKVDDIAKLGLRGTDKPLGFWKQGHNPWLDDKPLCQPIAIKNSSYSSCATLLTTCPPDGQPVHLK